MAAPGGGQADGGRVPVGVGAPAAAAGRARRAGDRGRHRRAGVPRQQGCAACLKPPQRFTCLYITKSIIGRLASISGVGACRNSCRGPGCPPQQNSGTKCRCPCAGAVAARMRVHDSGVCLVASHLSSGQAEGDELRRNYDYAEARARLAALSPFLVSYNKSQLCQQAEYIFWPCRVSHGPRQRPRRSRRLCRGIGSCLTDMYPASSLTFCLILQPHAYGLSPMFKGCWAPADRAPGLLPPGGRSGGRGGVIRGGARWRRAGRARAAAARRHQGAPAC